MNYLKSSRAWQLHMIMSLIGGYIGSYALLLRGGNFGSAVTGNFLEITIDIGNGILFGTLEVLPSILIRIGAAVIFGGSIALSYLLNSRTKLPMQRVTLIAEAAAAVITALIPAEAEPVLALYPIFFMSSFQWGTFAGADGFSCATIFSTNNLKQCVMGWTEYALTKQEPDKKKGCFYGLTILHFIVGGLAGAVLTLVLGTKSMLISLLFLAVAYLLAGNAADHSR